MLTYIVSENCMEWKAMKRQKRLFAAAGLPLSLIWFAGMSVGHAEDADATYRAKLSSVNAEATGSDAEGEASFTIAGDRLTIRVTEMGAAADMQHLQHFHGFVDADRISRCPTAADDANGDGIIDLAETEAGAGTTMVPFHDHPVSMEVASDTYPIAGPDGSYSYEKTVSLSALQKSFAEKFKGQDLDLARRVVFLHGVPDSMQLPATVASLGDISAQVTIPIACGKIEKVGR